MLIRKALIALETAKNALAGHQSGIRSALQTQRNLRRLQHIAPADVPRDARSTGDRLRRHGFLHVDPSYSDELIAALQDAMELAERPDTSVAMGGRIKESVRYVVDPLVHIPAIAELLTPELAGIVRAWYGTEFEVSTVRMWRIRGVPDDARHDHHYGNLWHLDGHPIDVLKLFVQVTPDVARCGSAFRFLSRPDTRRVLRRGYLNSERMLAPARRLIEQRTHVFDQPPGSAVFVDSNRCLHRAGMPHPEGPRGMVQFMFRPAMSSPPDGDYLASVAKDPNVYEGAIA